MVNTPKRIKAYLGSTFTGSLVIMPSEEISLVSYILVFSRAHFKIVRLRNLYMHVAIKSTI